MQNLKAKISDFVRIRTIPPVLNALLTELAKDKTSIDAISKIISQDISLTARLLRVANSAYYKRQTEIRTANQAINVLGTKAVKALVLSVSFFDLTGGLEHTVAINMRDFWRHNLEVAVLSSQIATDVQSIQPEEAFACGLLHDLGIVFFIQMMPEEYKQVLLQAANSDMLEITECKYMGANHSEIGAEIASAWKLPEIFRETIINHHLPAFQNSDDKTISIWHVVNLAHKYSRRGVDICPYISIENIRTRQVMMDHLGIKPEKVAATTSHVQEKVLSMAAYLDIDIGDPWNLLGRANAELGELYDLYEKAVIDNGRLQTEIERNTEKRLTTESMGVILQSFAQMIKSYNEVIDHNIKIVQSAIQSGAENTNKDNLGRALAAINEAISSVNSIVGELKQTTEAKPFSSTSALRIGEIHQKIKARLERPA
jgi:two-component system, cell cycle response regulator